MPYIKEGRRAPIWTDYDEPTTAGELNFLLTMTVLSFFVEKGLSYDEAINAAVGALECAKLELYRRIGGRYEDLKIRENGDLKLYEQIQRDNGLLEEEPRCKDKGGCTCAKKSGSEDLYETRSEGEGSP